MRERYRPGGATTIAIFHIILGGPGIFWYFYRTLLAVQGDSVFVEFQDLIRQIEAELPTLSIYSTAVPALSLLDSILMVVIAIGLLSDRNWARVLGLVQAAFALLYTVVDSVYYFGLYVPASARVMADFVGPEGQAVEFVARFSAVWSGFWNTAALVYFTIVIFVLAGRSTADYYRLRSTMWTEDW